MHIPPRAPSPRCAPRVRRSRSRGAARPCRPASFGSPVNWANCTGLVLGCIEAKLQVDMRLKALAEIYIMIWQKLIRNREPRLGTRFQPVALERGRRAVAVAGRRAVPPVEEPRRVPRAYRGLTNSTRTRIYAYSSKSSKLRVKFVTLE